MANWPGRWPGQPGTSSTQPRGSGFAHARDRALSQRAPPARSRPRRRGSSARAARTRREAERRVERARGGVRAAHLEETRRDAVGAQLVEQRRDQRAGRAPARRACCPRRASGSPLRRRRASRARSRCAGVDDPRAPRRAARASRGSTPPTTLPAARRARCARCSALVGRARASRRLQPHGARARRRRRSSGSSACATGSRARARPRRRCARCSSRTARAARAATRARTRARASRQRVGARRARSQRRARARDLRAAGRRRRSSSPGVISTRRSIRFCSSRTLPGQAYSRSFASAFARDRCGTRPARLGRVAREEALDQHRDVLAPLAQRGHVERDHVQPVEEVLAEAALATSRPAGPCWSPRSRARRPRSSRCRRRARSGAPAGCAGSWPASSGSCRRSRRGRSCRRRPSRSGRACVWIAPVKAPFSWPNSSLSISSSGIAAQFTATNGPPARLRAQVHPARDQLLAGAVLAGDQHPAVGRRGDLDLLLQLRHHRRLADDLALAEQRLAQLAGSRCASRARSSPWSMRSSSLS